MVLVSSVRLQQENCSSSVVGNRINGSAKLGGKIAFESRLSSRYWL